MDLEEIFWSKVRFESGCIIWLGYTDKKSGYGQFGGTYVHLWAYRRYVGPVPPGKELDHRCRRRNCVNFIFCLEPVTHRENMARSVASKTHCNRGHEYTLENTYWYQARFGLGRQCRICNAIRNKAVRDHKKTLTTDIFGRCG